MKKFAKFFLIPVLALLPLFSTTPTFAADPPSGTVDACDHILGLVAWNCHVDLDTINSTSTLSEAAWTIAANVATDLTVIAAYAVLAYVIYGGYLYIFAAGEPSKLAAGKKALSQAFIGLAIVMSANIILNTIRIALGANFAKNCAVFTGNPPDGCKNVVDVGAMITSMVQWVIGVAGVVAVIFIVYGAITYITSAGDAGKVAKAKNLLVYSLLGLAIVALAEIGTAFVSNLIRNATTSPTIYLDQNNSFIQTLETNHERNL